MQNNLFHKIYNTAFKRVLLWLVLCHFIFLIVLMVILHFSYEEEIQYFAELDSAMIIQQELVWQNVVVQAKQWAYHTPGYDKAIRLLISEGIVIPTNEVQPSFLNLPVEKYLRNLATTTEVNQLTFDEVLKLEGNDVFRFGDYIILTRTLGSSVEMSIFDIRAYTQTSKVLGLDLFEPDKWVKQGLSSKLLQIAIDQQIYSKVEPRRALSISRSYQIGEERVLLELTYDRYGYMERFFNISIFTTTLAALLLAVGAWSLGVLKEKDYNNNSQMVDKIANTPLTDLELLRFKVVGDQWNFSMEAYNRLITQFKKAIRHFRHKEAYLSEKKVGLEASNRQLNQTIEHIQRLNSHLRSTIAENDQNFYDIINTLANAIEAKDGYTRGHCDRVMHYSLLIAKKLDFTEGERKQLQFGSILHDVGKIGIHEYILNKSAPLTAEERLIIEKHADIGESITKELGDLQLAAQIVRYHHERYDGKGYPDGLQGSQIPLMARIVCIADAFDAMTSIRPYRPIPIPKDIALSLMKEQAGLQFDRELLDIFVEIVEEVSL